ncbi:MAG: T9SS type A sorting domain-containing protein, partial [Flavobacteriales bacterium]|nr:T9SS type A sorting domain-containing protein [Flavobacteriales bacterium]
DRTCYDFDSTPEMVDIAYTALTHLCVDIDPAWELDGQSFGINDCVSTGIAETTNDELVRTIVVTNDLLRIDFASQQKEVHLYDVNGRIITRGSGTTYNAVLPTKGIYMLRSMNVEGNRSVYRIVSQ